MVCNWAWVIALLNLASPFLTNTEIGQPKGPWPAGHVYKILSQFGQPFVSEGSVLTYLTTICTSPQFLLHLATDPLHLTQTSLQPQTKVMFDKANNSGGSRIIKRGGHKIMDALLS